MRNSSYLKLIAMNTVIGIPTFLSHPALAATGGDISSVQSFIQSLIQVLAGLAGLTATGFFVLGGFSYITSSGNPEHLEKAKRTLLYSGVGLAITIGAFVLSNIVTSLATKAFGS
jgi:hypothetical protein